MSNEEKERRCKSCGKLLIDEKGFLCSRSILQERDKTVLFGIGGAVMAALSVATYVNSNSKGNKS